MHKARRGFTSVWLIIRREKRKWKQADWNIYMEWMQWTPWGMTFLPKSIVFSSFFPLCHSQMEIGWQKSLGEREKWKRSRNCWGPWRRGAKLLLHPSPPSSLVPIKETTLERVDSWTWLSTVWIFLLFLGLIAKNRGDRKLLIVFGKKCFS